MRKTAIRGGTLVLGVAALGLAVAGTASAEPAAPSAAPAAVAPADEAPPVWVLPGVPLPLPDPTLGVPKLLAPVFGVLGALS